MEKVARYEWVYNRNSKNFKEKNKQASSWEKIGEKFNLTCLSCFEANVVVALGLKKQINLLAAQFPPRCPPCCLLRFSREHNARVYLTFPLNEIYGCSRLCDRLRSSAIIWQQLSLRSSAIICDDMETFSHMPSCSRLFEAKTTYFYLIFIVSVFCQGSEGGSVWFRVVFGWFRQVPGGYRVLHTPQQLKSSSERRISSVPALRTRSTKNR